MADSRPAATGPILITGGAGFIGTNLVDLLARTEDVPLVVLDALTYAGDLTGIRPHLDCGRVTFVHGDITDADCVEDTFVRHGITTVAHLAAESHVDRSIAGAAAFVDTNVTGTMRLLEAARRHLDADRGHRFVHVSTDEVFGDLGPDDPPFTVASSYRPSSPYAASKAASDHLVRAWHRTYGLPAVITNCGNNFGPWQFPEKLVPLMIMNAVDGQSLPVYGDGSQVRDWIHVADHAAALRTVMHRGEPGRTYLVGADSERSNLSLVHGICTLVDRALGRAEGTSRALVRHVTDRPGHDRRYALDAASVRALGWSPRHHVDAALAEVVEWYLAHREWCDAIRSGEYRQWYASQYRPGG